MNFSSHLRRIKWVTQRYHHSVRIIINNSWESSLIRSAFAHLRFLHISAQKQEVIEHVTAVLLALKICWLLVDRENDITVISCPSHYHLVHAKRWFYSRSCVESQMKMKRKIIQIQWNPFAFRGWIAVFTRREY